MSKCSVCREIKTLEQGMCEKCLDKVYEKAHEMLADPPEYLWDAAVDYAKEELWFNDTLAQKGGEK